MRGQCGRALDATHENPLPPRAHAFSVLRSLSHLRLDSLPMLCDAPTARATAGIFRGTTHRAALQPSHLRVGHNVLRGFQRGGRTRDGHEADQQADSIS